MKRVIILLLIILFAKTTVVAQNPDTTLQLEARFDTASVKQAVLDITYRSNSRANGYKPAQKAVDTVWFQNDIMYVRCVNDVEVFEKIKNKSKQSIEVDTPVKKEVFAKVQVVSPQPKKYKTEIDDFLNLEDTTIFTSEYLDLTKEQIHPRSYKYYMLVSLIHQMYLKLNEIDQLRYGQTTDARELLDKLNDIRIEVRDSYSFEKEHLLSQVQRNFYLSLEDKFNQRWDAEYPPKKSGEEGN